MTLLYCYAIAIVARSYVVELGGGGNLSILDVWSILDAPLFKPESAYKMQSVPSEPERVLEG